jgi:cytochrome c-type biogenesis protein
MAGAGDLFFPAVLSFCAAVVAHLVLLGVGSTELYLDLHSPHGLPGTLGALIVLAVAALLWLVGTRPWAAAGAGLAIGAVFGATWAPCVGTTLGRLLTPSGSDGARAALLAVYGFGLTIPFVLLPLCVGSIPRASAWIRSHHRGLARVGSVALVILGVGVATGWYRSIASRLASIVVAGT